MRAPCSLNSETMDCAFFRLPDGQAWLGSGPFAEAAEPPGSPCFYINDFTLSDQKPWKVPARLVPVAGPSDLQMHDGGAPEVFWDRPQAEWFKMVFRRIRRDVLSQRLRKMVPILTERGVLQGGRLATLLA